MLLRPQSKPAAEPANLPACSSSSQPASRSLPAVSRRRARRQACWAAAPGQRVATCYASTAEAPLDATPATLSWPSGFHERYELGDVLGRGSFGTVRTAFDRKTGRTLAAKLIPKARENVDPARIASRIQEEVSVMLQVQDCPEALQLHGVYQNATHVILVTDYCRGGDLEQFLQAQGVLTEKEAAQVAHDVLRVLAACHEQGILYADIKPANFLLAQPYPDTRDLMQGISAQAPIQIRVADFGCASRVAKGEKLHKRTGTPLYCSPDVFMQYFGVESDLWALGMMTYQMLSRRLPFWEEGVPRSPLAIMTGILSGELKFEGPAWEHISDDAKDLVSRLLDRDWNTRLTAEQALQHPWIVSQCGDEGCVLDHDAVDMDGGL